MPAGLEINESSDSSQNIINCWKETAENLVINVGMVCISSQCPRGGGGVVPGIRGVTYLRIFSNFHDSNLDNEK